METVGLGDSVRPNAEAIRLTNYREESRLVVRRNRGGGNRPCVACVAGMVKDWRDRGSDWMGEHEAWSRLPGAAPAQGALYAAGKESSAPLCLAHVDLVEGQR